MDNMTSVKCVKCQEEKRVSEAFWYKSKGYCQSCYYVKYEKCKLIKNIFESKNLC